MPAAELQLSQRGQYGPVLQQPPQDPDTFITVKYGDNVRVILNPKCPVYVLVAYLRQKCRCTRTVVLDLVDMDGDIMNLPERWSEYASNFIRGRQTYILIRHDRGADGGLCYTSLLGQIEGAHPDVAEKLVMLNALLVQQRQQSAVRNTRTRWGDAVMKFGRKSNSPKMTTATALSPKHRREVRLEQERTQI